MTDLKLFGKKVEFAKKTGKAQLRMVPRPGGWLIVEVLDAKSGEVVARTKTRIHQNAKSLSVLLEGTSLYFEKQTRIRGSQAGASAGGDEFVAQFPGKVRKWVAQEGKPVQPGDALILVEAMKMEFSIKASEPGKVKKFLVNPGDLIQPGQKLLEFECQKK